MSVKNILCSLLLLLSAVKLPATEIICTTYPVWLLTRTVAENVPGCSVDLLMPPGGGCAHSAAPRPGDLQKLQQEAVILVANGLGVDDHLIATALKINDRIKLIKAEVPALDPHTFASPHTAKLMVQKIAGELSLLLPEHQQHFQNNLHKFLPQLEKLIQRVRQLPLQQKYVVLQHGVFRNLLNLSGGKELLLKHESADLLSPGTLISLLQKSRQLQAVALWCDEAHDPACKIFIRTEKLPVVELDMLVSGPAEPAGDHYIKVMNQNIDKLESVMQ